MQLYFAFAFLFVSKKILCTPALLRPAQTARVLHFYHASHLSHTHLPLFCTRTMEWVFVCIRRTAGTPPVSINKERLARACMCACMLLEKVKKALLSLLHYYTTFFSGKGPCVKMRGDVAVCSSMSYWKTRKRLKEKLRQDNFPSLLSHLYPPPFPMTRHE